MRKIIWLLLIFPLISSAAVTYDSTSNNFVNNSSHNTNNVSHTATGNQRYAVVGLSLRGPAGSAFTATYDGVAMEQLATIENGCSEVVLFGLKDPSTESNATVAVSWTNNVLWSVVGVQTFNGVIATSTTDTAESASASTLSINLPTPNIYDALADVFASCGNAGNQPVVTATDQTSAYSVGITSMHGSGSHKTNSTNDEMAWNNHEADSLTLAGILLLGEQEQTSTQSSTTMTSYEELKYIVLAFAFFCIVAYGAYRLFK